MALLHEEAHRHLRERRSEAVELRAQAGERKKATAHHAAYQRFQQDYPDVLLKRGMRYVRADKVVFTAGGLSSGIDLALHVVELYFGRDVARQTARYMEYEGRGWMGDGSASMSFADK